MSRYVFLSLCVLLLGCPKPDPLPPALPEGLQFGSVSLPADAAPPENMQVIQSPLTAVAEIQVAEGIVSPEKGWYDKLRKQRPPWRQRQPWHHPPWSPPTSLPIPGMQPGPQPEDAALLTVAYQPGIRQGDVPPPLTRQGDLWGQSTRTAGKPDTPTQVFRSSALASLVTPRREWMVNGVVHYPYEMGRTYLVTVGTNAPSVVFVPPGLRIGTKLQVDEAVIDIIYPDKETPRSRETILIKGLGVKTQAVTPLIFTNGMALWLDIRVVDGTLTTRGVTWRVSDETLDLYGGIVGDEKKQVEVVPTPGIPPVDAGRIFRSYTIEAEGNPAWKPTQVYDDGKKTYIQFAESLRFTAAPALLAEDRYGHATPIDWTAYEVPGEPDKPSMYVTHGLRPKLVLMGEDGMRVTITRGVTRRLLTQQGDAK